MPLFIGRTILETECRGTCMNSGTCFPPHHWHSCCHNASILRSRNAAAGTLFSGQPHRHVLPDRLYSRFEKLLKNTDSYPITRCVSRSWTIFRAALFLPRVSQSATLPRHGPAALGRRQPEKGSKEPIKGHIFLPSERFEVGAGQGCR